MKQNASILPRRNAPGTVRKCFWKKCFSDVGIGLSLLADVRQGTTVRAILLLTVQSICNGRRDKDVPGAAQTVALSAVLQMEAGIWWSLCADSGLSG